MAASDGSLTAALPAAAATLVAVEVPAAASAPPTPNGAVRATAGSPTLPLASLPMDIAASVAPTTPPFGSMAPTAALKGELDASLVIDVQVCRAAQ